MYEKTLFYTIELTRWERFKNLFKKEKIKPVVNDVTFETDGSVTFMAGLHVGENMMARSK